MRRFPSGVISNARKHVVKTIHLQRYPEEDMINAIALRMFR